MTEPRFTGNLDGSPDGGPVDIVIPDWATPDQVRQFEQYVEAANRALAAQQEDS